MVFRANEGTAKLDRRVHSRRTRAPYLNSVCVYRPCLPWEARVLVGEPHAVGADDRSGTRIHTKRCRYQESNRSISDALPVPSPAARKVSSRETPDFLQAPGNLRSARVMHRKVTVRDQSLVVRQRFHLGLEKRLPGLPGRSPPARSLRCRRSAPRRRAVMPGAAGERALDPVFETARFGMAEGRETGRSQQTSLWCIWVESVVPYPVDSRWKYVRAPTTNLGLHRYAPVTVELQICFSRRDNARSRPCEAGPSSRAQERRLIG